MSAPTERTHRTNPSTLECARELRHPQTPAEAWLWARLREARRTGYAFRRQHPIGRFIVDFCCSACRLVVEIDGESHADQADYDLARTEWLEQQQYRVIRFGNREVFEHTDAVLQAILEECQQSRQPP